MIIPRLTSGYRNMLRSALGPSARISYKDYANELSLQNLRTMHRSKRERMQQALEALPTLENGGYEKNRANRTVTKARKVQHER